jgi:hypothetical protein
MGKVIAIAIYLAAGFGLAMSFDEWRLKHCGVGATWGQTAVLVTAYPLLGVAAAIYGITTPKENRAPSCKAVP